MALHESSPPPDAASMVPDDAAALLRLRAELQVARAYNRGLIEASVNAVILLDPDLRITDVNEQMVRLSGRARDQLVGSRLEAHFLEPAQAAAGIRRALDTGSLSHCELAIEAHAEHRGERRAERTIVSLSGGAIKDTGGQILGVVVGARDITRDKQLEDQIRAQNRELTETTAFLNNVLESSTQHSIIAKDLDGNILSWNEGARRNYGYRADEMIGRNARLLHAPEDVESGRVARLHDTARETGKAEAVLERVRKDGSRFTAALGITLRCDVGGAPSGYLMISKDITEHNRLEDQLRRKNDELEEQNVQIRGANRLKSEFLANMSHELRTPLNGIIGLAALMHDEKVGAISSDHKEYLGDVLSSARHLLHLINDVLDLAKVESGKLELHPVPVELARLLVEVCDILRTLAAEKRIAVACTVDPGIGQVVLDPAKLKQVLYNFVSNALKFTPDEGRVSVRVLPEGPDQLRLEVEDTGIGIPAAEFGRLFMEFHQLDGSSAKRYQGTGLGLALSRRIVEAQGGRVGVTSTLGCGSTFFAVLPRIAGPAVAELGRSTPVVLQASAHAVIHKATGASDELVAQIKRCLPYMRGGHGG